MHVFKWRSMTILLLLPFVSSLLLAPFACSQTTEMEQAATKNKKKILEKIKSGTKLSSSEINNLSGIYLLDKQYAAGIETFERLGNDEKYKKEKYLIDLNLAQFYLEQASVAGTNKKDLIEKAKMYLNLGVNSADEKATGLFFRSHIYQFEGCIEKAKKDLQDAKNIAQAKDLILYEDGLYLTRDKFLSMIQRDLDGLSKLKDACVLN